MNERYLSPIILQLVGLALLIGAAVFWAVTGRESVLLVSSAMSLIGLGAYKAAQRTLRDRLAHHQAHDKEESA